MARRYDQRTTTFSPEGRLFQVEYAVEAISQAGSVVGILASDGVVLAAEKKVTSKLLDQAKTREKLYEIDDHVVLGVAGIPSDGKILISKLQLSAQRSMYTYQTPMPVEQLVVGISNDKQGYTQFGGLRPFGVSFLIAGYDDQHGYQLYRTDPSGNYGGWKAHAIGQNNNTADQILRQDWNEGMDLKAALDLAAKVLVKTMDAATPNAEKVELATLTRDDQGKCRITYCNAETVGALLEKAAKEEEKKPEA
eukprot:CAMPEP_0194478384 /NCGR_PEP_ID=MMETSP0253-20130528/1846_1 /TAXON_ID=2966 /ORGANISM="Noctiluca scintillans" /LENGTH=250 /DNA_ID=CAMNT_0039317465 /DNA_START=25 /DNA_END=777 /DNA_ORIENTATION=+